MVAPADLGSRRPSWSGVVEQGLIDRLKAVGADRLPTWARLALAAVVLGAVGGLLALFLGAGAAVAATDSQEVALPRAVKVATTMAPAPQLVVQIGGAVARPGVYRVNDGSRLADLVQVAGGSSADADTARLNLAGRLSDGEAIIVPRAGEPPVEFEAPASSGAKGLSGGSSGPAGSVVDLNRATVEQLEELPGVGPATAAAIVRYRQSNGSFESVDGLLDVAGIGPAKLEALRGRARV